MMFSMENERSPYKSASKHCQEKTVDFKNSFIIDTQGRIHYAERLKSIPQFHKYKGSTFKDLFDWSYWLNWLA